MSRRAPSELVAASRAWLGTPFRHQGRSRTGLDCLGLLVVAHRGAGLEVRDATDYRRHPDLARMKSELDGQLVRLKRATPLAAGMVALFEERARTGAAVWLHVGLLTGPARFIHSRGPEDMGPGVVEHGLDGQSWGPRVLGLWRHPGLA